jgi:hypothetical protein
VVCEESFTANKQKKTLMSSFLPQMHSLVGEGLLVSRGDGGEKRGEGKIKKT